MSLGARILIVEDETDIANLVSLHLGRQGYITQTATDGETALFALSNEEFDLLLLDWMLPSLSGLEVARRTRARQDVMGQIPILMLTARSHTSDIIEGLDSGADDFLVKPFELSILLARVNALLRRSALGRMRTEEDKTLKVGNLKVTLSSYEVTCGKKTIALTISEFRLLAALMKSRGTVLTRDRLINQVQGDGVNVIDRTVDTHVFGLRKKLGECADTIETIRGVGYRVRIE